MRVTAIQQMVGDKGSGGEAQRRTRTDRVATPLTLHRSNGKVPACLNEEAYHERTKIEPLIGSGKNSDAWRHTTRVL
jgi:hypothetical protein